VGAALLLQKRRGVKEAGFTGSSTLRAHPRRARDERSVVMWILIAGLVCLAAVALVAEHRRRAARRARRLFEPLLYARRAGVGPRVPLRRAPGTPFRRAASAPATALLPAPR
jgi:hypothetical protein